MRSEKNLGKQGMRDEQSVLITRHHLPFDLPTNNLSSRHHHFNSALLFPIEAPHPALDFRMAKQKCCPVDEQRVGNCTTNMHLEVLKTSMLLKPTHLFFLLFHHTLRDKRGDA